MVSKPRRTFTKAFKLEAVKRSLEPDVSVKELAKELGLHDVLLSRWRRQFLEQGEDLSFPGNGNEALTDEQRENKRLKKELKERELELEILKKAISIFSKKDGISTNL